MYRRTYTTLCMALFINVQLQLILSTAIWSYVSNLTKSNIVLDQFIELHSFLPHHGDQWVLLVTKDPS